MDLAPSLHTITKDSAGNPGAAVACDWFAKAVEAQGLLAAREGTVLRLGKHGKSSPAPIVRGRGLGILTGRIEFTDAPHEVRIVATGEMSLAPHVVSVVLAGGAIWFSWMLALVILGVPTLAASIAASITRRRLAEFVDATAAELHAS